MSTPVKINLIINPIGMAFASIVIISIAGLAIINRRLTNRMTVRLVAAIALTDLLAHVGEYYAVTHGSLVVGTAHCTAVNGFRLFARTFYCWVNMAICLHIYRSLVLIKKTNWKSEVYIWTATAVLVITETLIYYGIGAFTGQAKRNCNPGVDDYTKHLAFLLLQSLTNLLTIAVCIFTTVKSHGNLNKWIDAVSATITEQGGDRDQLIRERKKIAFRSFLYPLSTCITLPFEAFFLIANGSGKMVIELAILMALTTGLSGILTALAFAVDPITHNAFKSAYSQIKHRNIYKKEDNIFGFTNDDIQLK
ncbi:hypothetical protein CONCODRAFT_3277 [Conidiobolus coronatus NRRL 28638]|uniref:G-protein coupled receptors family 1 profile domain-containing protein n=1 Tax=Conidiobolus coronatus (strain ATCC 28846 / CBS 209.66 / NRRL 28638) TaxID=796925 RepID=A0A137PFD7_CONC2|nr:hypothetical protein CONCODRAFT_3277 [Conidiobolus coronatus NRRL 28638]|eukprot:KXN73717.1 hypothetical protein CONCODRAFT_3277 [Conidiobolus coronatus NRRL 28638]